MRSTLLSSAVVRILSFALTAVLLLPALAVAQEETPHGHGDNRVREANRGLAARFTQAKMTEMVKSTYVRPRWLEGSERFWYTWEDASGKTYWIVDPAARSKELIFDNADMARQLTLLTRDPYDTQNLPIDSIRWVNDNTAIQFDVTSSEDEEMEEEGDSQEEGESRGRRSRPEKKVFHFEYDLGTGQVRELQDYEEPDDHPNWANISPDKQWVVFSRDHDLYMMSYSEYEEWLEKEKAKEDDDEDSDDSDDEAESDVDEDIDEIRLTTDGEEYYTYGRGTRGWTDKEKEENAGKRQPAFVTWSQDSGKFAMVRRDQREVDKLWVINAVAEPRPTLETYAYDMPGEENVTQSEVWWFDVASRTGQKVEADGGFVDESINLFNARRFFYPDSEEPRTSEWLSPDSNRLYWGRISRDLKRYDVMVTDLSSGTSTALIEERLNPYVETQRLELLDSGEMVWWSERDGWGHYYLYDASGNVVRQITQGEFSGRGVAGIDETSRTLYFTANGREDAEDPYYRHLYRVGLDGGQPTLLNSGDFDHVAAMGESTRFFVDGYSRVNTVPANALMDSDGEKIMDLESADMSLLNAAGYQFPEPYQVKGADNVTDLYGVIYKPFDFDETKKYPIIAYVYPGPQTEAVAKQFVTRAQNIHLANMGFIVVEIGNRGGHPWRSKWYHSYGYGDLRDYGLADKKAAIEQLADQYDWVDVDRVGIFGHSGGGFMSTAAMLVYPDFFDVAVSSSGNHENQIYNRWWSEKHHGVKEVTDSEGNVTFEYDIEKNSQLAANLKGKLLLTTGDIDNNVHPALTYRMAHALMKANKRFDFFLFPGERHGYRENSEYWQWLRADYFAEHLLGDAPDHVDVSEMNREKARSR
ncbi:MAG: prolyl oligopeptidase family serine peptidase [Acidobacteria bacterium]|nr:prolyl oligopeptidase family serine peptidase [Acidobacteriota bacterium]